MSEIATVGLDLAKNVFQVHGADASGRAVQRKKLQRDQVLAFLGQLLPCVVAMEACGGAHFWGGEIGRIGRDLRLIPPAYVKPFVKRRRAEQRLTIPPTCRTPQRPNAPVPPARADRPLSMPWIELRVAGVYPFTAGQGHPRRKDRSHVA